MKNLLLIITSLLLVVSCNTSTKKYNPEITANEIAKHIKYLSSDSMAGRMPGTEGARLSAEYVRENFKDIGLKLLGDNGFQSFELVTKSDFGKNNSFGFDNFTGKLNIDFSTFSFSKNDSLTAEAVFVGYGFNINSDSLKWNDYKDIDVKGKWVLILRGDPELENSASKFIPYSGERSKVLTAKDNGAAGVIFVAGVKFSEEDKLAALYYDNTSSNSGLPVINITRNVANKYFADTDLNKTIEELENEINNDNHGKSFPVPLVINATTDIILQKVETQNVIALLETNNPKYKDNYIVIGAHYDHLGMGGPGSGSRMIDTIAVHNGADDNASGIAAVIELAGKLASIKESLKRNIIFVAFGAEEEGLVGSMYFTNHPPVDIKHISAMINFDMVGRLDTISNSIMIGGTGTSVGAEDILNNCAENSGLALKFNSDGYGSSDHASFYGKGIPVFFVTTGAHVDYHTPFDDFKKINSKGEKKVLDFSLKLIENVANLDSNLVYIATAPKSGHRGGKRYKVTLGIMPDFASKESRGLGVDMVMPGGHAEKGGMENGDVITALNGMPVGNIYDYMNRLTKLKAGQIVTVDIIRDNKKKVLLVHL